MPEGVSNAGLLKLQSFREYVSEKRDLVVSLWKNPPPPVMLAYGAVVLTSGVLYSALGHWSKLAGFVWGSGLTAILNLAWIENKLGVATDGRPKIRQWLVKVGDGYQLPGSSREELENLFLELVQWELIFQVNGRLSGAMREELNRVLQTEGGEDARSKVINQFLNQAGFQAFTAKELVDEAVGQAVLGTVEVWSGN